MDSVDSSCHLYKRLPVRHTMLPCERAQFVRGITWFSQSRSLIIEKCPNGLSYFNLAFRHENGLSAAIEAKYFALDSSSLDLGLTVDHKTELDECLNYWFSLKAFKLWMYACGIIQQKTTKSGWNQSNMFYLCRHSSIYLSSILYLQYLYTLWKAVKI